MPVSNATPVKSHTGNGVTTVFAYDFRILKNTDLKVTVNGVTKTLTTDYTVSGVGDSGGGNVTFVLAPANGTAIVLEGNASYDRTTDYQRSGSFDEETVDKDFDHAVILIKQLKAILDRIPQLKAGLTLTQPSLPDPIALRFLRWKSDLSGFENLDIATLGSLAVSDFMKTVLDDADAAAARTTLGVAALTEGIWTPSLTATGATFNYVSRVGRYTLVGKRLFFSLRIELATSGNTLSANAVTINLPVTSANVTNLTSLAICDWGNVTTSMIKIGAYVGANTSTMLLYKTTAAATDSLSTTFIANDLSATAGSILWITGSYEVA